MSNTTGLLENKVNQFNMIESKNYNVMSTKGKKSMVGNLVEFQDGTIYMITKTGSLRRMPSNFSVDNQEKLEKRYNQQQEETQKDNTEISLPSTIEKSTEKSNEIFELSD
jgi:hypothetical protein